MNYYDSLPRFEDRYLQYYNSATEAFEIRKKSTTDGVLSISETMELITKFMIVYQGTYIKHSVDDSLYIFPFLFKRPQEGQIITNLSTKERYTVDQVIVNPESNVWEGVVKLDLSSAPDPVRQDVLLFDNEGIYVKFDHLMPSSLTNYKTANINEVMDNPPQINPTITWNLARVEPGGMNKAFSSKKELKARQREVVKDPLVPGYSVQILGKSLDNIVEFMSWSNDHRTSERLINWFYRFLEMYTPYLRQCGVQQMYFLRRDDDSVSNRWRQTFYGRNLQYYFRTEEIEANYEKDLTNVDVVLGTELSDITRRIYKERRYIAGQEVTGELSNQEYRNLFYRSGEYLFGNVDISS